jgi:hypothetical protein
LNFREFGQPKLSVVIHKTRISLTFLFSIRVYLLASA